MMHFSPHAPTTPTSECLHLARPTISRDYREKRPFAPQEKLEFVPDMGSVAARQARSMPRPGPRDYGRRSLYTPHLVGGHLAIWSCAISAPQHLAIFVRCRTSQSCSVSDHGLTDQIDYVLELSRSNSVSVGILSCSSEHAMAAWKDVGATHVCQNPSPPDQALTLSRVQRYLIEVCPRCTVLFG